MPLRPAIALLILFSLATALIFLSWFFDGINLILFEGAPLVLEGQVPLYLGQVPLSLVCLVLALIIMNVLTELAGQGVSLITGIGAALALSVIWAVFSLLPFIPWMEAREDWLTTYRLVINLSPAYLFKTTVVVVIGFTSVTAFFSLFRRMTKGRFDYFRLFMSSLMGIVVITVIEVAFHFYPEWDRTSMLALFITRYAQWLVLTLFLLPLYYLLKALFYYFTHQAPYHSGGKTGLFTHLHGPDLEPENPEAPALKASDAPLAQGKPNP